MRRIPYSNTSMTVESFRELMVWKKAILLVKEIYLYTQNFPRDEIYGLTSQMRRSAVSIPSNIAEGSERRTTKDFLQFLHVARGSAAELETQIIISTSLYPNVELKSAQLLLDEVQRMLKALMQSLEDKKEFTPHSALHTPHSV
ncbi:MAG: four helix bundle protein [bacterium]